jgi:hypothetical protein
MAAESSGSSKPADANFTLELSPAQLKVTHTALMTFLHDFGHEEVEVGRFVKEVLAKFPPEEEIKAIDISGYFSKRG